MFAYIPARQGSKRVPGKNIKLLDGKPVIAHVIETLKSLSFIDHIFVSTDSPEIAKLVKTFGAETLELRSQELSNNKAGFGDLIRSDMKRYCEFANSSEVLFCLATAALVTKSIYTSAYKEYIEKKPEILMSAELLRHSPFWAFSKCPDGFWQPLFPKFVTVNSQNLPEAATDAGLFYFFNVSTMQNYPCHKLARKLLPFFVPERVAIDVDTPNDWDLLEARYTHLKTEGIL